MARSVSGFSFLMIILVHLGVTIPAKHKFTALEPDVVMTISLADYHSSDINGQAFYKSAILAPNSDSLIQINDIPKEVSLLIVQAHVHENNVTLFYNDTASYGKSNGSVYGSNVGLAIYVDGNITARMVVRNALSETIDALIVAVGYTDKAPTPGGCNMEFDVEVSPFQKLRITEATVTLEAQMASAPPKNGVIPSCEKHPVELTAYRMYLPEREFTPETYFDGIRKMMTVQSIIENGQKILPAIGGSSVRRVFSAYPGTGSIYAMIATYGNYSSAYVPAATYACSPLSSSTSCGNLNTTLAQALCAIVLTLGFIIAFIGHKCLGFEVVFLGAISGGIISYTVLTAIGNFETSTILGIVMGTSFISGIGSLILTCCMGMPCIATFLASMTLGFFVASTIYFGIADDTPLFESDRNFWLIYTGVALLVPLVLAVLPFSSNVVCCAILGSYSIILPIDYYAGSNLKYIVINTLRRATVPEFNVAVIQPPYQSTDKCLVAFLIIIALLGIYVQVGKICCCSGHDGALWQTTVLSDERQPILSQSRNGRRVLVFGEYDRIQSNW